MALLNQTRVTGFGFLASKEVKAAGVGNLGLQDRKLALCDLPSCAFILMFPLYCRKRSSSLGSEIYWRFRRRSNKSNNVCATLSYSPDSLIAEHPIPSWGESAGAISVSLQMLANGGNTEGLFRAGFMQSGSPIPVGDITNGQEYYDALVTQTGCSGSTDTLACLRKAPYPLLKAAINNSPSIFAYQVSPLF